MNLDLDLVISRISSVLEERGINVTTFASTIGITQANMSNILNKKSKPASETLFKMINTLEIDLLGSNELTALIDHQGQFYKAKTLDELKGVVKKIEGNK